MEHKSNYLPMTEFALPLCQSRVHTRAAAEPPSKADRELSRLLI
jgi:hypothetical protein